MQEVSVSLPPQSTSSPSFILDMEWNSLLSGRFEVSLEHELVLEEGSSTSVDNSVSYPPVMKMTSDFFFLKDNLKPLPDSKSSEWNLRIALDIGRVIGGGKMEPHIFSWQWFPCWSQNWRKSNLQ